MAPLEVYTCCSYPARRGRRTPAQWAAVQFVRALKGQPIAGISIVPLPDGTHGLLDVTTAEQSVCLFGRMAAAAAPWEECGRVALVPLPNSWCDITCRQPSRTVMLADAVVRCHPLLAATVCDVLRWGAPMEAAHAAGGTRDPQELYSALRLRDRRSFDRTLNYVIVDDVLVTGAHVRAAAAFLTDCGAQVLCAICAARAEHVLRDNPFHSRLELLPRFTADPDWLLPFRSG